MTFAKKSAFYILVSLLLLLVYPLDLYFPTGNQCIYFFWGIKDTGFGFLSNDFLATQPDPFPLFSLIVTYSSQLCGNSVFLFWYWLINFIYVIAIFEIAEEAYGKLDYKLNRILFTVLFLFANSTLVWGFFFTQFFNFDLRWAWDSGFAEQGILRGYFQPSCFGVFILLSFMFFIKASSQPSPKAKRKSYLFAFVSAALAACFHANYLLVSGVFILVYILFLAREKNYKTAITGGVISFLIVLPYLIYILKNFGSVSPETIEYINNHIKGHIHFDYHVWLNKETFLQLSLILFSLWLMRKTVLFFPLLAALFILMVLTLLTYLSGSIFLLNLTPWRISVVLIPVALAIVLSFLSSGENKTLYRLNFSFIIAIILSALYFRIFGNNSSEYMLKWRIFTVLAFVAITLLIFISEKYFPPDFFNKIISAKTIILLLCLGLSGILLHKKHRESEVGLMVFVRKNLSEKQQYLIPPEMTDFRLTTGVPVFVDSTNYHSNALPEWDKRLTIVNQLYREENLILLDSLVKNCGITHIVTGNEMGFPMNKKIYGIGRYAIFELNER